MKIIGNTKRADHIILLRNFIFSAAWAWRFHPDFSINIVINESLEETFMWDTNSFTLHVPKRPESIGLTYETV